MNSILEGFLNPFTTTRTLNTRASWVISNCPLTAFDRNCSEDIEEASPCRIQYRLGESGSRQALNVQVFKRYQVILTAQPMCDLIMKLFSLSGNMQVKTSNLIRLSLVVLGTLLHSCQLSLLTG